RRPLLGALPKAAGGDDGRARARDLRRSDWKGWPMTRHALDLTINGESHQLMVEPHWSLLQVLRGELGMTGTKENCLEAECGVCTVLLDGKAVNSCILLAEQARGRSVVTIEGLGDPEHLHPLQRAFIDHG